MLRTDEEMRLSSSVGRKFAAIEGIMRPVPSPVYFALVPDLRAAAIGTVWTFLGHQSLFSGNPGFHQAFKG